MMEISEYNGSSNTTWLARKGSKLVITSLLFIIAVLLGVIVYFVIEGNVYVAHSPKIDNDLSNVTTPIMSENATTNPIILSTTAMPIATTTNYVDVLATESDVIAQGACVGMNNQEGWVYAVRRNCASNQPTCKEICELKSLASQDSQVASKAGKCEMALHVYASRPQLTEVNQLGPKVYRYKSCRSGGCGPNYCCCRFIP